MTEDIEDYPGYHDAEHLRQLADRCERGADQLQRDADDPVGVLSERGGLIGDLNEALEWGRRHGAAAAAAREYAAGLRAEADALGDGERTTPERIAQAEKVATAAELDGILIDGRRLADDMASGAFADDRAYRQAHRDSAQAAAAQIEGSGMFAHVAETIDGVEQVPYWQLGGTTAAAGDDAGHSDSAANDDEVMDVAPATDTTGDPKEDEMSDDAPTPEPEPRPAPRPESTDNTSAAGRPTVDYATWQRWGESHDDPADGM
jgi:hypothetical protein